VKMKQCFVTLRRTVVPSTRFCQSGVALRCFSTSPSDIPGGNKAPSSPNTHQHRTNFRTRVLDQTMELRDAMPIVIVAGAAGEKGQKIVKRLLTTPAAEFLDCSNTPFSGHPVDAIPQCDFPTRFRLVLMDIKPCPPELDITDTNGHEIEYIQCDFTKYDNKWVQKFDAGYIAFLVATNIHFPHATCHEAYHSMVMQSNLLEACSAGQVERVCIASSTDVVRGSLDKEGTINANADPDIGLKCEVCGSEMDSTLYAAGKVAHEAQARAMVASGQLNRVIVLRFGTMQPVESLITQIAKASGKAEIAELINEGKVQPSNPRDEFLLKWFKGVRLYDEDLDGLVDLCVTPGLDGNDSKLIYVNAISGTPDCKLEVHNKDLGYVPQPQPQHHHPAEEHRAEPVIM